MSLFQLTVKRCISGSPSGKITPEARRSAWKMFTLDIEVLPLLFVTGMTFGAFGYWLGNKFIDPLGSTSFFIVFMNQKTDPWSLRTL